jgi:CRISPR-associated protein Cas2
VALTVLVAYDVSKDSARARCAALLQAWGDRLQRSVFLCAIDEPDLAALVAKLEDLMDHDTDSLVVLRQCANCWDSLYTCGQTSVEPEPLCWAVM